MDRCGSTPRLAVIGAGLIGRRHIEQVVREAALSAIVDPDPYAQQIAAQHRVPCFTTLQALLESHSTDGVIIATPTQMHVDNALRCIEAGLPVLVEKPIADSLAGARRLVAASDTLGVPVLIGHHRRHNPLIQAAYQQIQSGRIGRLVAVHAVCWLYKPDDYFDVAWRRTSAAGPVLTNLIHDIDLLRYLCGDVVSVQAYESRQIREHDVEDTAVLLLKFNNGTLGTMTVSDSIVSPWSWELTANENPVYPYTETSCYYIGGTRGSLSLPDLSRWHNPAQPDWYEPMLCNDIPHNEEDPLSLQIRHFCRVILGEVEPLVSGHEGLQTLRVVSAAKEAARTGTLITL